MQNSRISRVPVSVLAVLAAGRPAFGAVFANVDAVIQNFRDRQSELLESQQAILAKADDEKRELTVEEQKEHDGLAAEFDRLEKNIQARERTIAQAATLAAPQARRAEPEGADEVVASPARPNAAASRVPAQPRRANGNAGFQSFGDFAMRVRNANPSFGGQVDNRLLPLAAATTYGNEGVGADGGFAVPADFRADIMARVFGEDSLVVRTDRQVSSSNQITFPSDMTTPWQASGGIQAYWDGEGVANTASKPALENLTVKAHKLACLVPITEELMEDAPALDGYLRAKAPEIMDFKISNALIRGSGVGQPLGILNAPSLVTVSKESAQTADTINQQNCSKMFAAMPIRSRANAVWLIHPDAEPQLHGMTVGQMPVYLPAGGLSDAPYGRLFGRPVIPHEVCETVGDLGDIMFVDFNQYLTLTKTGAGRDANGMKLDVSMHLWFDQGISAFRFTLRMGGQPWWSSKITPRDGTNYRSPYVVLEAR